MLGYFEAIASNSGFKSVNSTSNKQISSSARSQKCFSGLKSGVCRAHYSAINFHGKRKTVWDDLSSIIWSQPGMVEEGEMDLTT